MYIYIYIYIYTWLQTLIWYIYIYICVWKIINTIWNYIYIYIFTYTTSKQFAIILGMLVPRNSLHPFNFSIRRRRQWHWDSKCCRMPRSSPGEGFVGWILFHVWVKQRLGNASNPHETSALSWHSHGWYAYHSQSWVVYAIVLVLCVVHVYLVDHSTNHMHIFDAMFASVGWISYVGWTNLLRKWEDPPSMFVSSICLCILMVQL